MKDLIGIICFFIGLLLTIIICLLLTIKKQKEQNENYQIVLPVSDIPFDEKKYHGKYKSNK